MSSSISDARTTNATHREENQKTRESFFPLDVTDARRLKLQYWLVVLIVSGWIDAAVTIWGAMTHTLIELNPLVYFSGGPLSWYFAASKFVFGPLVFGAMTYGALKLKNSHARWILATVVRLETVLTVIIAGWTLAQLTLAFTFS